MKSIPPEIKTLLLSLSEKFPSEKREKFKRAVNERLDQLATGRTAKYALIGAICGVIFDAIPMTGFITDDPVEIGAAIGAWVGYSKDEKEKAERERIANLIKEILKEALA